jgi:hypothetical protein
VAAEGKTARSASNMVVREAAAMEVGEEAVSSRRVTVVVRPADVKKIDGSAGKGELPPPPPGQLPPPRDEKP